MSKICAKCRRNSVSKGKVCVECKSIKFTLKSEIDEPKRWESVSKKEYVRIASLPYYYLKKRKVYLDGRNRYFLNSDNFKVMKFKKAENRNGTKVENGT